MIVWFLSYLSSEYMSSRLFWMGVPVTAQRARALSWQTAMEVCTLGFLMLWASSRTILAQATRSRGGEWGAWTNREERNEFFLLPHCTNTRVQSFPSPVEGDTLHSSVQLYEDSAWNEAWMLKWGLKYHVVRILAGFLSIFLLDGDLFGDQAVCGHHHIMVSEPAGRTGNGAYGSF